MKEIEEYFEEVKHVETGEVIGMTVDIEGLAKDRAKDLFPKTKHDRQVFIQGLIEGHTIGAMIAKKNYDKPEPVKPKTKLFLPNQ